MAIKKYKKKRVLILGSSGTLGSYLLTHSPKNITLLHNGINKKKLDLNNITNIKNLLKIKPDIIINCIASIDIELCQKNKKKTFKVNTMITKNIFKIKKKYNLNFQYLFISTDQMYNNDYSSSELSKTKIYNYYTESKIMAEKLVLKNKGTVLRTNFFGKVTGKKTFTDWIIDNFKKINSLFYLINDISFSPLRIHTLSRAIFRLVNNFPNRAEIFNLGASSALTKEEFAILFAKKMHVYTPKYISIEYKELLNVKRSKNMSMCSKKFHKYFNFKINSLEREISNESKSYKSL